MIILCLVLIPIVYILIKFILYFIVCKFGKFSYDGLSVAGFAYHSKKDIFYATKNAWQKNFGYSHLYDVGAPIFRMIIDTESVKFTYQEKNWLITFWKGQYGITTGAEIGIYCTKEKEVNKKTIYLPVSHDEMLNMSFVLYRKGKKIIHVSAKHWWLAAFKLGMFSNPKDLVMDINIAFPNPKMLNAFLISFKKLGYQSKDYRVFDNTFTFTYKKPRTHQVWTRSFLTDHITQYLNHRNVRLYHQFLDDYIDDNRIDDSKSNHHFIMVKDLIPDILKGTLDKEEKIDPKIKSTCYKNNTVLLNDKIYSNLKKNDQ